MKTPNENYMKTPFSAVFFKYNFYCLGTIKAKKRKIKMHKLCKIAAHLKKARSRLKKA